MAALLLFLAASPAISALVSRVKLSPKGPEVSRIAYGTLHLAGLGSPTEARARIDTALAAGITTFDLSDVYGGADKLFGQAINLAPSVRGKMEIIAKMDVSSVGYDTSVEHLTEVLNNYLKYLSTDYLDLVLLHRQDYLMDVKEIGELFKKWQAAGTVRAFGTSNFDANSWNNLNRYVPLVTNEIEVSVWAPETIAPATSGPISPNWYFTNNGLVDFHYSQDVHVLAWGPLGGDPYARENRLFKQTGDRQKAIRSVLSQVGTQLKASEDQVALAWVLRHPSGIVPILGTINTTRIQQQSVVEGVAKAMTRQQWYTIAKVCNLPLP